MQARNTSKGAATPLSYFQVRHDSGTVLRMPLRPAWIACAGLLWPAIACAQVTVTGEYLERIDTDADGRISLAEYQAWMGYAFERMDANGDAILTPDELPGGKGKAISLDEHREALAAMFRRQDANGDGFLDADELSAPPR